LANADGGFVAAHAAIGDLNAAAANGRAHGSSSGLVDRVLGTIVDHVQLQASRREPTGDQVRVELDPPELGSVTIVVDGSADGTRVTIRADLPETQWLLEQNSSALLAALDKAGVSLKHLDIGQGDRSFRQRDDREAVFGEETPADPPDAVIRQEPRPNRIQFIA
jgi:flagellar hook-length control protein FliK